MSSLGNINAKIKHFSDNMSKSYKEQNRLPQNRLPQ